jgi:hypothetical protein
VGCEQEKIFHELVERHNALVHELRDLEKESEEYVAHFNEIKSIRFQLSDYRIVRGSQSYGLLAEATPYAEKLLQSEKAMDNLALIRVLYSGNDGSLSSENTFPYWHNLAPAYLELEQCSPQEIIQKFDALVEHMKQFRQRPDQVAQEKIMYSMIDKGFYFSLTPAVVAERLDSAAPDWKSYPATHVNKDSYLSYNNFSDLDIFELNRLKEVAAQLAHPNFREQVFAARKEDLDHPYSEHGGTIDRPEKGPNLRVFTPKEIFGNSYYVIPNETALAGFTSPATFHFHATKIDEGPEHQGPGGGDMGFFSPGVVFSSVSESEILVHFYASRQRWGADGNREDVNVVICLGTIKKEKTK